MLLRVSTGLLGVVLSLVWAHLAFAFRSVEADWSVPAALGLGLLVGGVLVVFRRDLLSRALLSECAIVAACYSIAIGRFGYTWETAAAVVFGMVAPVALLFGQTQRDKPNYPNGTKEWQAAEEPIAKERAPTQRSST